MVMNSELGDMENDTSEPCTKDWCDFKHKMKGHMHCHGCGGAVSGLGFIAALVSYPSRRPPAFWDGVLGFFEALFWPAFLVYGVLNSSGREAQDRKTHRFTRRLEHPECLGRLIEIWGEVLTSNMVEHPAPHDILPHSTSPAARGLDEDSRNGHLS